MRKLLQRNRLDGTNGFFIWAVRTRTLQGEIMHALTSNGALRDVGDLLIVGATPKHITGTQRAEYVDATTRLRDLVLERIHLERDHIDMEAAREQLKNDMKTLQSAGTEPISYGKLLKMVYEKRCFCNAGVVPVR